MNVGHMATLEPEALVIAFACAVEMALRSRGPGEGRGMEESRDALAAELLRRLTATRGETPA